MVAEAPRSPFFRPSQPIQYTQTPGGTKHRRKPAPGEKEKKTTVLGCSANLINAIVGSGIVGIPYAVKQSGLVAGICLIMLCAFLTEKSLRLLIETAKHAHVPSYEVVAEAAFGRFGFAFVAINMFVMSYGAMLSYLMIVKDSFSNILGISEDDMPMRRAVLFLISVTVILPLSCQRDMASLAFTSKISVMFDIIMVGLVVYIAPIQNNLESIQWSRSIIHMDTIFIGLGVLSFAFVCQHSAFIIAGSLEQPTRIRWTYVTRIALSACNCLALCCGVGGYLGYLEDTQGNILNSLDESYSANVARALLGVTMLFVFPMESFVARHVCVVLFFQGKSAHEGDDASVLNRRDRRITLTLVLYLLALIPAASFTDLGKVLASTGAIGGSCLSYIGPGAVYLGIHGGRFLELSASFFGRPKELPPAEDTEPLYKPEAMSHPTPIILDEVPWFINLYKTILWYVTLMPVWCFIASVGKTYLTSHVHDLALQSPHPIRIGNVRYASTQLRGGATRVVMLQQKNSSSGSNTPTRTSGMPTDAMLIRADSLPKGFGHATTQEGNIVALPPTPTRTKGLPMNKTAPKNVNYQSINQQIGARLLQNRKESAMDEEALEDDPQEIPPSPSDFAVAIFYIVFGVVAMTVGLICIYNQNEVVGR